MERDYGDPKLGWLEAFVATAYQLDFKLAADRLRASEITARRSVEYLEIWLHKLLIIDDGQVELYEVDGVEFLPVACRILRDFQSFKRRGAEHDRPLSLAKSALSNVRLSELASFLSIAETRNYKLSAFDLQCSHDQLRKNVRKLEHIFHSKFVSGWSRIALTDSGLRFLRLAQDTVSALQGSVADISRYDPLVPHLKESLTACLRRRGELSVVIARADRKRHPRKRHISEAKAAEAQLPLIDGNISALRKIMHSRESTPA